MQASCRPSSRHVKQEAFSLDQSIAMAMQFAADGCVGVHIRLDAVCMVYRPECVDMQIAEWEWVGAVR